MPATGNRSVLERYAEYVCGADSAVSNDFLTDPMVSLNAELAELQGGCVNMWLERTECNMLPPVA